MWLKDPKTGKRSVTLTVFITTFLVCVTRLALSGVSFGSVVMPLFGGADFAACVGAAGAIYFGRKHTDANSNLSSEE